MRRRPLLAALAALATAAALAGVPSAVQLGDALTRPPGQLATTGSPIRIVTIGDSITAGVNSSDGLGYRSFLAERLRDLGYEPTIINASAGGLTLATIDPYIAAALQANAGQPVDFFVWNLGTNDVWGPLDGWPERYRDKVRKYLDMFPGARALVAQMIWTPVNAAKIRNVNVWIRDNTVKPLVPRAKVLDLGFGLPNTFDTDGTHPGDGGYSLMADLTVHALRPWLP